MTPKGRDNFLSGTLKWKMSQKRKLLFKVPSYKKQKRKGRLLIKPLYVFKYSLWEIMSCKCDPACLHSSTSGTLPKDNRNL